jgi:hypothetical protein
MRIFVIYVRPNTNVVIISGMRWAGYVAHMGGTRNHIEFLPGNPKGRFRLRETGVDGFFNLIKGNSM